MDDLLKGHVKGKKVFNVKHSKQNTPEPTSYAHQSKQYNALQFCIKPAQLSYCNKKQRIRYLLKRRI